MPQTLRHNRGSVLGITMMTALICGIAAYAVLQASISEARHSRFTKERIESRYLAEAGVVYAREQLWTAPAGSYCGETRQIDTNGNGTLDAGEPSVVITVTPCGPGGAQHTITARADY